MNAQPCYKIYESINDVPTLWNELNDNVFLNDKYLRSQEQALPSNLKQYYVAIYRQNSLIGKFIFQLINLNSNDTIVLEKFKIAKKLISILNYNLLCVGNIQSTGENAYELSPDLELEQFYKILKSAIDDIIRISKSKGRKINLILIKDFYTEKIIKFESFFSNYNKFSVQPNMVLEIPDTWNSISDYEFELKSKYRTRYHRAKKKIKGIQFLELNANEILEQQKSIYICYQNVLQNLDFSLYILPKKYFYSMKKNLGEKYKFYAGYLNDEIVCFYSLLNNKNNLEASYLGYNSKLQQAKQLYLNMLYHIISHGIENNYKTITFSRSALEIKSSVGAKPIETFGMMKHTNFIMHRSLELMFKQIYSPQNWKPRSPFKN